MTDYDQWRTDASELSETEKQERERELRSSKELCYCAICGPPQFEFSDKEIDAMRRKLAASWQQSITQVTEYEAVYYLRQRNNP